jgi:O-antigen ligase
MDPLVLLLFGAVAIPGVFLMIRSPRLGLYALVATFPFFTTPAILKVGGVVLSAQKLVGLAAIGMFVFDAIANRRKVYFKGPLLLLTVVLFVLLTVSHFINGVQDSGWIQRFVANAIFVFLVVNWVEDRQQLSRVRSTYMCALLFAVVATELFPGFGGESEEIAAAGPGGVDRLEATFVNANGAAQAYLLGLGVTGAWLIAGIRSRWRLVVGVGLTAVMMYFLVYTGSRSAFIGLVTMLGSTGILFLRSRGGKVGIFFLLAFGIWMVVDPPELMKKRIQTIPFLTQQAREEQAESGSSRMFQYRFALTQLRDNPVFGIGPNRFNIVYGQRVETMNRSLHSWYLMAGMDAGIPGMVVYLALFFFSLLAFIWSARLAKDEPERIARQFLGILVISTAVFGLFSSVPYSKLFFFIVGIAAAEWKLNEQDQAEAAALDEAEEEAIVVQGQPLGSARRSAWR